MTTVPCYALYISPDVGLEIRRQDIPYKLMKRFAKVSQKIILDCITDILPMFFLPSFINFLCYVAVEFMVQ